MRLTRSWPIALVLTAIIVVSFAAGYLAGTHAARVQMHRRFDPERWNVYAMDMLRRELDLTPAQEQRIQGHIDRAVDEMKQVHRQTVERTAQIVDHLLDAIGGELTPEQQRRAEALAPDREELTIDLLKVKPRKP